ncbi:MAG: phosphoribosylamine--glycine ligase, partial [Pseudomonadota bacterium]|nr:phosphoribosylamine--glycine ligase [Pseudomonadota bacterium]
MKVLIIGGGGREHALAWKLAQSPRVTNVFVAPGNAGTALEDTITNVDLSVADLDGLVTFAKRQNIDYTVVGPEAPLVDGIVDRFEAKGLHCFGPSAECARLEGSKAFTKEFLKRHNIPTAAYGTFTDVDQAIAYLDEVGAPIVVKADGLAAGKGVILAQTLNKAKSAVRDMLQGNQFGDAGRQVVIEEFLTGEEASFIVMVDGTDV